MGCHFLYETGPNYVSFKQYLVGPPPPLYVCSPSKYKREQYNINECLVICREEDMQLSLTLNNTGCPPLFYRRALRNAYLTSCDR